MTSLLRASSATPGSGRDHLQATSARRHAARGVCLPDLEILPNGLVQKLLVSVSWRPGLCARQDIAVGVAKLKEQMANPMRLGAKGSKENPLNMGGAPRCGPFQ